MLMIFILILIFEEEVICVILLVNILIMKKFDGRDEVVWIMVGLNGLGWGNMRLEWESGLRIGRSFV